MKKGLSRMRMRICILMFIVGLVLLLAGYVVDGWVTTLPALVLVLAALFIKPGCCPTCGKYVGPSPQWSEPGKYHCRYCGSRLFYDDEPED